ncbi:hypothetical protein J4441_04045 [Candidatus Micrarchaeota archaeon]|nr:hypothetical protein [Candidatus Micrarchaeota archaeon]
MVLFFSRDLQNAAGAISALIAVAQFHDQPSQVPQELVANAKRGLESLRFYVPMDADPKTTANLKFLEDFIASTKL